MPMTHPTLETLQERQRMANRDYYNDLNYATKSTANTKHVSNMFDTSISGQTMFDAIDPNAPPQRPPSWFTQWEQGFKTGQGRGGSRSSNYQSPKLSVPKLQGANSIPQENLPPTVTSGTPSSGSPIMVIVVVAVLGLGGWYWWHKAHLTAAQDKKASA